MQPISCFILLLAYTPILFFHGHAGEFDYPTANVSNVWTINNGLLREASGYPDGSMIRPILIRGHFGPSFACGFSCSGACDAFFFTISIVYTNSASQITDLLGPPPQVVWSANRDRPVAENATLQFSADGNLLLRDADGTLVWSTNTSNMSVVGMNLTETGNLVLFTESNTTVWDSVDYPIDTLVLGQTLKEGQRLTTGIFATNGTKWRFYLSIVSDGIEAYVDSNPPQLYYKNVIEGSRAANRSTYITFTNGSLTIFHASKTQITQQNLITLTHPASLQYMRLDYDGHLRIYGWAGSSGWRVMVDSMFSYRDNCAYPMICGEYGICSINQCSCPGGSDGAPGYFRQVDQLQPSLGCTPVTPLSCQSNATHQLLLLNNVSYFNCLDTAAVAIPHTSEEICKQACLKNCSCKAAVFQYSGNASDGSCYLPSQLFSLMSIKPQVIKFNSSAHIKVQNLPTVLSHNLPISPIGSSSYMPYVPISPIGSSSYMPNDSNGFKKNKVNVRFLVGSAIAVVFTAAIVIGIASGAVRGKKVMDTLERDQFNMITGIPTRFSFEELKVATDNFHLKLGEGGFGSVFEGKLSNGTRVAVKRLDGVGQGEKQFLAEVETIGKIHHIHLVRLIGFCTAKSHRLLVYEYMCNGSLDKWIFDKGQDTALDWQTRRRIITDIAKGLSYLHEECRQRIVHLDIKPQNILLDEEFNAKVSDFGLSKLIDRNESHVMTRMRGTPGYLAPEWLTSKISEKADVYSFGVVVMEIVCGRKSLDYLQLDESVNLIRLLQGKIETNQLLDMVDNRNKDVQAHGEDVMEIMKLALWCLQSDKNKRPSMSLVVKVLECSVSMEFNLDFKFSTLDPFISHNASSLVQSVPPSASILSGPR